MIRAYTHSAEHAKVLEQAASARGYPLEVQTQLDREILLAALPVTEVIVVDLTQPVFPARRTIELLDSIGSEDLPPVLWLLAQQSDVTLLTAAEHILNQDFTFAPVTVEALALRLEVLTLLGARRRMALESAISDRLTGLYNRKYFLRRLEEEMYRAIRYGYNVGCILADVDFQGGSGELSESTGTAAVRGIAEMLISRLRRTDVISRFRFSEFGVLLPDIPREDSVAVAQDVKRKIESLKVETAGPASQLRAAVGHLCFPANGVNTAIEVVSALEDNCLKAKQGDGFCDYEPQAG
jgi:diguanylate cyclase (GGDEF)-like protein